VTDNLQTYLQDGASLDFTSAHHECLALPNLTSSIEVTVRTQGRQYTADDRVEEVSRDPS